MYAYKIFAEIFRRLSMLPTSVFLIDLSMITRKTLGVQFGPDGSFKIFSDKTSVEKKVDQVFAFKPIADLNQNADQTRLLDVKIFPIGQKNKIIYKNIPMDKNGNNIDEDVQAKFNEIFRQAYNNFSSELQSNLFFYIKITLVQNRFYDPASI